MSGVGGISYGVQGLTLIGALPIDEPQSQYRYVWLRVLVCSDIKSDRIVGLPSIQFYNLLPLLNTHLAATICCEVCAIPSHNTTQHNSGYAQDSERDTRPLWAEQSGCHTFIGDWFISGWSIAHSLTTSSFLHGTYGDHGRPASCGAYLPTCTDPL